MLCVQTRPAVRGAERGEVTFQAGGASRRHYKPEPPCSIQESLKGLGGKAGDPGLHGVLRESALRPWSPRNKPGGKKCLTST